MHHRGRDTASVKCEPSYSQQPAAHPLCLPMHIALQTTSMMQLVDMTSNDSLHEAVCKIEGIVPTRALLLHSAVRELLQAECGQAPPHTAFTEALANVLDHDDKIPAYYPEGVHGAGLAIAAAKIDALQPLQSPNAHDMLLHKERLLKNGMLLCASPPVTKCVVCGAPELHLWRSTRPCWFYTCKHSAPGTLYVGTCRKCSTEHRCSYFKPGETCEGSGRKVSYSQYPVKPSLVRIREKTTQNPLWRNE